MIGCHSTINLVFSDKFIDDVLVDCFTYELGNFPYQAIPVHHLRLHDFSALMSGDGSDELTWAIQADEVPLRSLYINLAEQSNRTVDEMAMGYMEGLIRVCGQKGIEVVFEESPSDAIDSYGSDEFCRRQRERDL